MRWPKWPPLRSTKVKRSQSIENAHKTAENAHKRSCKRSRTVNGQERLGTFESECSNALERIVENVTVRSRSRFKNKRITLQFCITLKLFLVLTGAALPASQGSHLRALLFFLKKQTTSFAFSNKKIYTIYY
jgi:hypothetical protein